MKEASLFYNNCMLCGRKCGVDRSKNFGFCKSGSTPTVSRAGLHMWEEPLISGSRGSGTVFFSSCSLGCIFCQNADISRRPVGRYVKEGELADLMLSLEGQGAHNINFVTPTHFAPSVAEAIKIARGRGLSIPTVYNSGGYDSLHALEILDGHIDVYLADYKFVREKTARELAYSENYPEIAKAAIAEMVRQQPTPVIEDGIMKRGVIVRVLLLPGHVAEAKLIVKYLYDTYGDSIYISLMSQYTPVPGMAGALSRKVTREEYRELVDYAVRLGVENAFIQDLSSSGEEYIPDFDTAPLK